MKSVAMATATPFSTSRRAGAKLAPRYRLVQGSRQAMTPLRAMLSMPSSGQTMRCSAETAPSSPASCEPPMGWISSAWSLGSRPWALPASRMRRDSSAVKTPSSQNTSQNRASPSAAARGIISSQSSRR